LILENDPWEQTRKLKIKDKMRRVDKENRFPGAFIGRSKTSGFVSDPKTLTRKMRANWYQTVMSCEMSGIDRTFGRGLAISRCQMRKCFA
jgi:hypothetical protein